jgi:hypothetical protein
MNINLNVVYRWTIACMLDEQMRRQVRGCAPERRRLLTCRYAIEKNGTCLVFVSFAVPCVPCVVAVMNGAESLKKEWTSIIHRCIAVLRTKTPGRKGAQGGYRAIKCGGSGQRDYHLMGFSFGTRRCINWCRLVGVAP